MAMAKKPRKEIEDKSPSTSNSSGSDELSYDTGNESSSSVESGLVLTHKLCVYLVTFVCVCIYIYI